MTVDIKAECAAALRETFRELTAEQETVVERVVRRVLDERDADAMGGLSDLAKWCGAPTADAMRKRMEGPGGDHELDAMAMRSKAGTRSWKKSEVMNLLMSRRAAQNGVKP